MGAVPIIMAAVSVAGTYAGIQAQNRAASQQNAIYDAQVSANKDYERIRQYQARIQKNIILDQAAIQKQAIRTNTEAERIQLQNTRRSLFYSLQNTLAQNNLQANAIAYELSQQQQALTAAQRDVATSTKEAETAAIVQATQAVSQLEDPATQIRDLQNQLSVSAAQMKAYAGSQGKTSGSLGRLTPNQRFQVAQALQQQRGLSAEAAQAIADSTEFAKIYQDTVNMQIENQSARFGLSGRQSRQSLDLQNKMARQQYRAGRDQIGTAIRQVGLGQKVGINQTNMNTKFALGSLITGQGLNAAQAAAASAQAAASRQSGPSFLSQIAAYGQALTPLLQGLGGGSSVSPYQSLYGMQPTSNKDFYSLQQSTSSKGFSSLYQSPKGFSSLYQSPYTNAYQPQAVTTGMYGGQIGATTTAPINIPVVSPKNFGAVR